ncbi:MAG: efflux RND transporter periplasmic adaptor subunit [Bryobacteraceae bacterium]
MKKTLVLSLLPILALMVWVLRKKSEDPRIPFAKTTRQTLSDTVSTNGKVEPIEYTDVHVDASGMVKRLLVHQGDTVRQGQVLAELSQPGLTEDLQASEARVEEARAALDTLRAGGRTEDRAELQGNLNRLITERGAAQRNLESLERLLASKAATSFEVQQAQQNVSDLDVQIQSLRTRESSLVGKGDLDSAEARLREAEANVQLARTHLGQNTIRAPLAGTVYDLPAREGAYLNAGDPVASVGKLDPVRVRVYVDEPELGRVAPGEAVRITWDALAGKEWTGTVEKRPSEVVALGTRQVGEVLCTIANPHRELVPGTNVNAFILTQVVENALTIPKTAVRRESGIGVYVLQKDDTVKWQSVKTGVSDALRLEVASGLHDGDAVAQPSDLPLKDGMKVIPEIQ